MQDRAESELGLRLKKDRAESELELRLKQDRSEGGHALASLALTEQWFCHPLLTLLRKANSFGSWSVTGRLF